MLQLGAGLGHRNSTARVVLTAEKTVPGARQAKPACCLGLGSSWLDGRNHGRHLRAAEEVGKK